MPQDSHYHLCPELQIHGSKMVEVNEDIYLGDIISSDWKNDKNIKTRVSEGIALISDIMEMLEKITLGEF